MPRAFALAFVLAVGAIATASDSHAADPDTRLGTDFQYDFVAATWIARGLPMESLDRGTADALGRSLGTVPVPVPRGPAHTHPPPATAIVRPLLPLGYRGAAIAFFCLSIVALLVLAQVLLGVWRHETQLPGPRSSLLLALGLGVWPPTLYNLGDGQWSLLGAALVAAGWWSLARGSTRGAAVWLASAISIKTTPLALGAYLLINARRVAVWVAGLCAAIAVITLPYTGGMSAWRSYFASTPVALRVFEGLPYNTASVRGVFVRLFVPSEHVASVFNNPRLGHALTTGITLALVVVALVLTIRRAGTRGPQQVDPPAFAMWASLMPLINPLSWGHNMLFLLLPMALLGRDAQRKERVFLAVALGLLSVPTKTLFLIAGPPPERFPASRAWVLGIHALAGLMVFATACFASARTCDRIATANQPAE